MKRPTKFAMIGAGGIGCALAPMLCREGHLVIIDADKYEPGNVTRQFPALTSTENKAKTLAELIQQQTLNKVDWIDSYLRDALLTGREEWRGVDMIVGGVDNNASRRIIVEVAECLDIPAILAGNEHEHGEAHLYIPGHYNPFDHFSFPETEPVPWGCNTDKALEEHPQTAIANILAAGCTMHLLLSYLKVSNPLNAIVYSRNDALSSTYKRAKDMLASAGAEPQTCASTQDANT